MRSCLEKEAHRQKARLAFWKAQKKQREEAAHPPANLVVISAEWCAPALDPEPPVPRAHATRARAPSHVAERTPPLINPSPFHALVVVTRRSSKQLDESSLVRADSISLHPGLLKACAADKERLCPGVRPVEGAVMSCLALHADDTLMADECREKLADFTAKQGTDFRLNPALAAACRQDILSSPCGSLKLGGGKVLACLLEREEQLGSPTCKAEVAKMGRLITADVRYNTVRGRPPLPGRGAARQRAAHSPLPPSSAAAALPRVRRAPSRRRAVRARRAGAAALSRARQGQDLGLPEAQCHQAARQLLRRGLAPHDDAGARPAEPALTTAQPPATAAATATAIAITTPPRPPPAASNRLRPPHQARDVLYNPHIVRACGHEIHEPKFCGGVSHGGGAVLACLEERRLQAGFSYKCSAAVLEEQKLHAADIELMVALKTSCKPELKELCNYTGAAAAKQKAEAANASAYRDAVAPYVTCLRSQPLAELTSPECKAKVRAMQLAASENIALNPELNAACAAEQKKLCGGVAVGGGGRIACLEAQAQKGAPLSDACHDKLLAFQASALAHVRGHWPIANACGGEMERFCSTLAYRHAAMGNKQPEVLRTRTKGALHLRRWAAKQVTVLGCLQASTQRAGFGGACLAKVKEATQVQLSDMRADRALFGACAALAERSCPDQLAAARPRGASPTEAVVRGVPSRRMMGVVFECVQDELSQKGELSDYADGVNTSACAAEMRRVSRLHAAFPTASAPLQQACAAELREVCGGGSDGNASSALAGSLHEDRRLLACLRKPEATNRLSDGCRAKAVAMERLAHRELAHNAEVHAACHAELQMHCAGDISGEAEGEARGRDQVACLDRFSRAEGEGAFGPACKRVLLQYQLRATESLELLDDVRQPCALDYASLCAGASAQSHPGAAVQCLKDNRDQLQSDSCHAAVLKVMARAAADARFDPILSALCAPEMAACAHEGVLSGEGRVHACLRRRAKEHSLSAACRQQVFKAQQAELEDVRLNYPVQSSCKVELVRFCAQAPTPFPPTLAPTLAPPPPPPPHHHPPPLELVRLCARRCPPGRRVASPASRRTRATKTLARAARRCCTARCATRSGTAHLAAPRRTSSDLRPTPRPTSARPLARPRSRPRPPR